MSTEPRRRSDYNRINVPAIDLLQIYGTLPRIPNSSPARCLARTLAPMSGLSAPSPQLQLALNALQAYDENNFDLLPEMFTEVGRSARPNARAHGLIYRRLREFRTFPA
jgi:hypothetical protein